MTANGPPLDVAIVGGGIAGVIHLHYARRAGLHARVFEKGTGVGGLWRSLPAWQDIQISPADWALAGVPIDGALQPQVLANIEGWVKTFALADGIRLDTPVEKARPTPDGWDLHLPGGVVQEWGRWLRSPRYLLDHVPESDRAFAELDFPVEVVAVADDGYAPEAAVAALAATMPTATLARWEPAAWGLAEIGHFGLLRQPALWDHAAEALRGLAGVGGRRAARVA